jgi:hypothetical protein
LFLDASHRLTLDPRFFPPGEDSAARGRRLTRFAKMKRPIPAQGPRLNARIVGLCKEDRTCTVVMAPPGTVDPLAELGERQVRPGFVPLAMLWPGWWDDLFPCGGLTLEACWEWSLLHTTVGHAREGDLRAALATAEARLAERSAPMTLPSDGPFWSVLVEHDGEEAALFKAEAVYGIDARSWSELKASSAFRERLRGPAPVLALFGWLGYMWWEVVSDLRGGYVPRTCGNCGSTIVPRGRRPRQYCTQEENEACWRERGRTRTRRSRDRRAPG